MSKVTHDERCEGAVCWCSVREVAWVAREARMLASMDVPAEGTVERAYWQCRWDWYVSRKMALLAHVEGA